MKRESGINTVEFAIVSAAFFLILFGALEMSRLLFVWNTLDSITQRTARLAAVCPLNHASVKSVGMYGNSGGGTGVLRDFTAENLLITYRDESGTATANPLTTRFVEVQIVGYTIDLAIPFVEATGLLSPSFRHVVSAESLGRNPDTGDYSCFGA